LSCQCPTDQTRTVEDFCTIVVPQNFSIVPDIPVHITFDPSCIACQFIPCQESVEFADPCNPSHHLRCPVELVQVFAQGCIFWIASVEVTNHPVCPQNAKTASLSCHGNTCISNLVSLNCASTCPNFCQTSATAVIDSISPLPNGSVVLTIKVTFILPKF
jgi:hypothetical protein